MVLTAPTTPVTPTISIPVPPWTPGVFHDDPLPTKVLPIQLVHCIISVTGVLKLHKPIPVKLIG